MTVFLYFEMVCILLHLSKYKEKINKIHSTEIYFLKAKGLTAIVYLQALGPTIIPLLLYDLY